MLKVMGILHDSGGGKLSLPLPGNEGSSSSWKRSYSLLFWQIKTPLNRGGRETGLLDVQQVGGRAACLVQIISRVACSLVDTLVFLREMSSCRRRRRNRLGINSLAKRGCWILNRGVREEKGGWFLELGDSAAAASIKDAL